MSITQFIVFWFIIGAANNVLDGLMIGSRTMKRNVVVFFLGPLGYVAVILSLIYIIMNPSVLKDDDEEE